MTEIILIIILTVLVIVLAVSIIIRYRRTRGTIFIKEEAINELVTAMVNNIRAGKIQDIAGKVSFILKKYLDCDKIIFLKYYKGALELNYYSGLQRFEREDFRVRLTPNLQSKLKSFHQISRIEELSSVLPPDYSKIIKQTGFAYFFPAYLRENLYGVYFISTSLPPENRQLQFLSTALAFNLSTAYHIGIQEQQIKRYEDRFRQLGEIKERAVSSRDVESGSELVKYLRIRNSRELIPELINGLRKDCSFSRMAFYVRADEPNEAMVSVRWNLNEETDRIFKENYDSIISRLQPDKICDLKNPAPSFQALEGKWSKLQNGNISYLTALPWTDNRKALLAWSGSQMVDEVAEKLRRFKLEALPLVENVSRFEKAEELSYTDGLTGIYNFRYFQKRIREEFMRAKRYGRNLALLIFDVDDLKNINDKYGHLAGDNLLKCFGAVLMESVRSNDVISRYGGDEFCLIMPETSREKAHLFMERIQEKIAITPCVIEGSGQKHKYSVSIGGAVFPLDADSIDTLIDAADMALLKAKSEGRNCCRMYQSEFSHKS